MGRRQEIKQFILGNFLFTDDDSAFTDDTSLIQQGIVDSTGILELIVFIEETWPVRVPAEDMTPATFDSLGAIDRYLDGRLAACAGFMMQVLVARLEHTAAALPKPTAIHKGARHNVYYGLGATPTRSSVVD